MTKASTVYGLCSHRRNAPGMIMCLAAVLSRAPLLPIGAVAPIAAWAQTNNGGADESRRTADVIYGRKAGMALTMDVFTPSKQNRAAVVFLVSGGWLSSHDDLAMVHVTPGNFHPYLSRGYTVFAVVHGSQPYFSIPDIVLDIHRAVRFIRRHADEYGIDSQRIGILGSSSGGQLALMIGTQGGPGPADAPDPVDRESSAVESVACFFPPTDFLNWGAPGVEAVGRGPLSPLIGAFGTIGSTEQGRQMLGKLISPIYFVTASLPPVLIIHGDADIVVPLQQSEAFAAKAKAVGAPPVKIIVRKGKGHGWGDFWRSSEDVEAFADWFDEHLTAKGR